MCIFSHIFGHNIMAIEKKDDHSDKNCSSPLFREIFGINPRLVFASVISAALYKISPSLEGGDGNHMVNPYRMVLEAHRLIVTS